MKEGREALMAVGLSQYEADVYLALLAEAPANGSQVARRSGVPRSMVYQTLEKLAEKGAVLVAPGDPVMYAPSPPAEFLRPIQQRFAAACQAVASLADSRTPAERALAWNLRGWAPIQSRAASLSQEAGAAILAGGDPSLLSRLLPNLAAVRPGGRSQPHLAALVVPDREALLVWAADRSEPTAVCSGQPAVMAAATALVTAAPAVRRPVRAAGGWVPREWPTW